ncbi:MAG: Gfo/Idh/MocA family oxidoreductase [Oscillatoria sp. SIO1A7]|nr:Gfo/Idh/MocA family oxidoreductase [Oscillatoria sp. SIO1A7]
MLLKKVIPKNELIGLLGCVRVGYGTVAFWHEKKLRALGIDIIGIIDSDPVKQKEAAKRGIKVFSSLAEAADNYPFFWDICCPTKYHVEIIRDIIEIDERANIIVEKPSLLLLRYRKAV